MREKHIEKEYREVSSWTTERDVVVETQDLKKKPDHTAWARSVFVLNNNRNDIKEQAKPGVAIARWRHIKETLTSPSCLCFEI
nr:hypothetical protein CFP56_73305 [Quercus suber]